MTYLLYFRSVIKKADDDDNEYVIFTQDEKRKHREFTRPGFALWQRIEIDDDLDGLPLDRELSPR